MTTRSQWVNEGLNVLKLQGRSGVRIDRIAERLGLTKGSFHHHFIGIGDYRSALLTRCEEDSMTSIRAAIFAASELPSHQALARVAPDVSLDPRLDAAMRAWAFEDESARAVQGRVDTARLEALVALWRGILPDPSHAHIAALVPYLVMVSSSAAFPTPSEAELRSVFALLATLVPSVK
ncbi:TetR/AcrR family transcriptional regulator [Arthrobacter psychrochitiniphilus]|uniref:TetR/AcrR family transcriptional regulator n=1 Tax=Arthrobacter psychrochitiniphilus TaxID=291045 RepID=UPI003F7C5614